MLLKAQAWACQLLIVEQSVKLLLHSWKSWWSLWHKTILLKGHPYQDLHLYCKGQKYQSSSERISKVFLTCHEVSCFLIASFLEEKYFGWKMVSGRCLIHKFQFKLILYSQTLNIEIRVLQWETSGNVNNRQYSQLCLLLWERKGLKISLGVRKNVFLFLIVLVGAFSSFCCLLQFSNNYA